MFAETTTPTFAVKQLGEKYRNDWEVSERFSNDWEVPKRNSNEGENPSIFSEQ
jgi:hypothetical protein